MPLELTELQSRKTGSAVYMCQLQKKRERRRKKEKKKRGKEKEKKVKKYTLERKESNGGICGHGSFSGKEEKERGKEVKNSNKTQPKKRIGDIIYIQR